MAQRKPSRSASAYSSREYAQLSSGDKAAARSVNEEMQPIRGPSIGLLRSDPQKTKLRRQRLTFSINKLAWCLTDCQLCKKKTRSGGFFISIWAIRPAVQMFILSWSKQRRIVILQIRCAGWIILSAKIAWYSSIVLAAYLHSQSSL